jgi:hypothetical protein
MTADDTPNPRAIAPSCRRSGQTGFEWDKTTHVRVVECTRLAIVLEPFSFDGSRTRR